MKHECKYFNVIPKYHTRICTFCYKRSYNYGNKWTPEISIDRFVYKWTGGMGAGTGYNKYLRIDVSLPFEARSYESWDIMYSITFLRGQYEGKTFEWYGSLNEADFDMEVKHNLAPMFEHDRTFKEKQK